MRTITRLAGWTFGWVLANQVALVVVLALADGAKVPGAVSAYTYAYTFFQLPYGVVAVSVMTAVDPVAGRPLGPAATWSRFRHRMAFGLRGILAIIIPSAVGMVILAHPLIDLVLAHGAETVGRGRLPPPPRWPCSRSACPASAPSSTWCGSSRPCRTPAPPFRLYLVENGINIVLGGRPGRPARGPRAWPCRSPSPTRWPPCWPCRWSARRVGGLGGDDLTTPVKPGARSPRR